jgi:hypothetical protein
VQAGSAQVMGLKRQLQGLQQQQQQPGDTRCMFTSIWLVAWRRLLLWRLCWWWGRTWRSPQATLQDRDKESSTRT